MGTGLNGIIYSMTLSDPNPGFKVIVYKSNI